MSIEVQRVLSIIVGLICVVACFRKRFYGASIGGSTGRAVHPWGARAFLLAIAAFFFWAALVGLR